MKIISIFILGLVVGYFIKTNFSNGTKHNEQQKIVATKVNVESKPMKMLSASKLSEVKLKNQLTPSSQVKEKRKLSISIEENLISRMETDWNALRDQAETIPDDKGWKITIREQNSLFNQAGLQNGDYINKDSLRAAFNNPNNDPALLNRFEYILNYISR